jgi:hypothetical protein
MLTVFYGSIGMWNKDLGSRINSILQSDYPPKLKAAILTLFYELFSLPKEC